MSDWWMGSTAALDRYEPEGNWPREPTEQDHVAAASAAAAQRLARPYERANRESQSYVPAVADFLKPETPLDYALMLSTGGAGLVGKALLSAPRAFRIGAVAAGAATTADETQAGVGNIAKKAMRGLDAWADTPTREQTGQSFILPGDTRVSTRYPTAVGRSEDPLERHLSVGMGDMFRHSTPDQLAHNIDLVSQYPGFAHLKGMSPEEAARAYVDQTYGNLRYVWDQSPRVMQERSPVWYEGANRFTTALADRYGIPRPAASGGTAVLSPQKDWFQNASLAERVGDIVTGGNKKWDPDMLRYARQNEAFSSEKNWEIVRRIAGKSLDQIDDPLERAAWVRLWDEVKNPRHYREVTPEGGLGDFVRNEGGTPAKVAWGSGGEVAKAIQMYQSGGAMDEISRLLGNKHKVRSFYNNIELPMDARFGDVTSDTHQVAAGLLRPLSGNTPEVAHNFGSSLDTKFQPPGYRGTMNSSVTGLQGTYPLQVEATRRLAADVGVLPRAAQSGVWEPVRTLFSDVFKSNPDNVKAIDDIWKAYDNGKISIEEARRAVFERAGGIREPSWARPGFTTHDPAKTSTYR
jgi:hypothetical protein